MAILHHAYRSRRYPERFGRLVNVETSEEPELHDAALPGVDGGKCFERVTTIGLPRKSSSLFWIPNDEVHATLPDTPLKCSRIEVRVVRPA